MSTLTQQPTRETAIKILDLLQHGLSSGLGDPVPGKMCIEAVHRAALGLSHGDETPCKAPAVRSFDITLNDSSWSSNSARAKGMKRLAIAGIGSIDIDQTLFVKELVLATVRKIVPLALRAAAKIHPQQEHKDAMEAAAVKCEGCEDNAAAHYTAAAARAARAADAAARRRRRRRRRRTR